MVTTTAKGEGKDKFRTGSLVPPFPQGLNESARGQSSTKDALAAARVVGSEHDCLTSLAGNEALSIAARAGAGEPDHTRALDRVIHAHWYLLDVNIAGGFGWFWARQSST